MSRFFTGDRNTTKAPIKASKLFMDALRSGGKALAESQEERYSKIFDQKMEAQKKELATKSKYSFQLPGTSQEERPVSKSVQAIMEKIAQKKAKQDAKKKKKEKDITIYPKYFTGQQGGRIDKKGNIYSQCGQVIMKVDLKTGKIKNMQGMCVGTYNPNSTFAEHKIAELIDKYSRMPGAGWNSATGGITSNGGGMDLTNNLVTNMWSFNKSDESGWW